MAAANSSSSFPPFIYVSSLRRTGSTVLSEALTLLPHCFIFREPRLGEQRFRVTPADAAWLARQGINVEAMIARWRAAQRSSFVAAFHDELMPALHKFVRQIGVKEIRNAGWSEYVRNFPGVRIVMTARDPRDVYLSLHDRIAAGTSSWKGELTPERLFADLNVEFGYQRAMRDAVPTQCMVVRYEDLCTQPGLVEQVKEFCSSEIPGVGQVGGFNASNPNRVMEQKMHGSAITAQRVNRWQGEANAELRSQAQRFFDLMEDYCDCFGYAREGVVLAADCKSR